LTSIRVLNCVTDPQTCSFSTCSHPANTVSVLEAPNRAKPILTWTGSLPLSYARPPHKLQCYQGKPLCDLSWGVQWEDTVRNFAHLDEVGAFTCSRVWSVLHAVHAVQLRTLRTCAQLLRPTAATAPASGPSLREVHILPICTPRYSQQWLPRPVTPRRVSQLPGLPSPHAHVGPSMFEATPGGGFPLGAMESTDRWERRRQDPRCLVCSRGLPHETCPQRAHVELSSTFCVTQMSELSSSLAAGEHRSG
jgi:hypothetical protein